MLKAIVISLLFILLVSGASGQLRAGIAAGVNISNVSLSSRVQFGYGGAQTYIKRNSVNDYYGGIVSDIKVGKSFLIKTGALYAKKGWKEIAINESAGTGVIVHKETTTVFTLNAVQVPVSFMFASPLGNGRMYIGTGPYINYTFGGSGGNTDSLFRKTDFGIHSVLGFETSFGLFFEAGFDLGLSELYKEKILGNDTRYRNILIGAGFWFNNKKNGKNSN